MNSNVTYFSSTLALYDFTVSYSEVRYYYQVRCYQEQYYQVHFWIEPPLSFKTLVPEPFLLNLQ